MYILSTTHLIFIKSGQIALMSPVLLTSHIKVFCTCICESLHKSLLDLASISTKTQQCLVHVQCTGFDVHTF